MENGLSIKRIEVFLNGETLAILFYTLLVVCPIVLMATPHGVYAQAEIINTEDIVIHQGEGQLYIEGHAFNLITPREFIRHGLLQGVHDVIESSPAFNTRVSDLQIVFTDTPLSSGNSFSGAMIQTDSTTYILFNDIDTMVSMEEQYAQAYYVAVHESAHVIATGRSIGYNYLASLGLTTRPTLNVIATSNDLDEFNIYLYFEYVQTANELVSGNMQSLFDLYSDSFGTDEPGEQPHFDPDYAGTNILELSAEFMTWYFIGGEAAVHSILYPDLVENINNLLFNNTDPIGNLLVTDSEYVTETTFMDLVADPSYTFHEYTLAEAGYFYREFIIQYREFFADNPNSTDDELAEFADSLANNIIDDINSDLALRWEINPEINIDSRVTPQIVLNDYDGDTVHTYFEVESIP